MQDTQEDEDAYDPDPEASGSEPVPPENPPVPGVADPHAEPEEAVSPPPTLVAPKVGITKYILGQLDSQCF